MRPERSGEDADLPAQRFQRLFILFFQIRTGEGVHVGPVAACRDAGLLSVRRPGILVRHFQKNVVGKLVQIMALGHAVVPQLAAHAPYLGDDG